jgi:phage shock protein A
MGVRLSFGKGPLRVSVPLTSSGGRSRGKTWHAIATFPDGSEYKCSHGHRTQEAAVTCAQKYRRDKAAGKPVPPLTKKPKKSKLVAATTPRSQPQDELRARVSASLDDVQSSAAKVQQQIAALRQSVEKLDNLMDDALRAHRDDLARDASRRKVALRKQLMDLESQYEALSAEQVKLEAAARKLV